MRTAFLEAHPEAVAAFVEATHKGQDVVLNDPDTASGYMEAEFGSSRDDFDFTVSYTDFEDTFTPAMRADFDVIEEWLLAQGHNRNARRFRCVPVERQRSRNRRIGSRRTSRRA